MEQVKIIHSGKDSRLIEGYVYGLERLSNGLLRFVSGGGRWSCLVNPDTSDVEFEYTNETRGPSTAWRNPYAAKLWATIYTQSLRDSYSPVAAADRADTGVALFNERWRGDNFTNVGVAA
mgnify:FL=1